MALNMICDLCGTTEPVTDYRKIDLTRLGMAGTYNAIRVETRIHTCQQCEHRLGKLLVEFAKDIDAKLNDLKHKD